MSEARLRLAELLAALSLAADLGNGVPMETTLRGCILATRLAVHADATQSDIAATYYTGLLWSAGCTSTANEERIRFGGDIGLKRAMTGADSNGSSPACGPPKRQSGAARSTRASTSSSAGWRWAMRATKSCRSG